MTVVKHKKPDSTEAMEGRDALYLNLSNFYLLILLKLSYSSQEHQHILSWLVSILKLV